MKYPVLSYIKHLQAAQSSTAFFAPQAVIVDHTHQRHYQEAYAYMEEIQRRLHGKEIKVIRCDDFQQDVILLLQIESDGQAVRDYIGYFKVDDTGIYRIDEYWSERVIAYEDCHSSATARQ